ncbi:GvpL/GvpF family gas vesicle protein [Streptomyces sp. NPDC054887]
MTGSTEDRALTGSTPPTGSAATSATSESSATSATVTYVYGVAAPRDGLREAVASLRGVADAPVRLVTGEAGGPAAIAGDVPARDFEAAPLAAHFEDLTWLEAVARAHHGVIDAVAAGGTVLPLRLATIYRDDDRVRAMLTADRTAFERRLARLAGSVEWGVKVYFAPPPEPAAATPPASGAELSPGRAYLRSRHRERDTRQDAIRAAAESAQRVEAAARAHAVEQARHRPQQGPLAGGSGDNIVNDAYLVPREGAEDFRLAVERAAAESGAIRVEITGPWAPYSFAASGLDDSGAQGPEVIV